MSLSDPQGPFAVSHERDITMTTRDGKRLLADIYRPKGIHTAPVLLRRTPNGNQNYDLAETPNKDRPAASNSDESVGKPIDVNHVATLGKSRAYHDADQVSCEVKNTGGCRCTGLTSPR